MDACLYTNPSPRTGYDTKSIYNQRKDDLNSKFSFSKVGCSTKSKDHSQQGRGPIHTFFDGNVKSLVTDRNYIYIYI